jgi:hypothetical protein
MTLWVVAIVDGRFGRPVGTAKVWAGDAETAKRAVDDKLRGESSYGEPYRVTEANPCDAADPFVVVIDYD